MLMSMIRLLVRPAAAMALLVVFLPAGCGDPLGRDDSVGQKNWAVIVGISNYKASSFNLKWAEEDALDFYDALRNSKGWETDNITLLTNSSATGGAIKSALAGLAKRVSSDDRVVFYFSGRGSFGPDRPPFDEADGLDEYLVPFDGLPNSPADDVSDDTIEALLSALPTNNVVIILDAGFTGASSPFRIPSEKEKFIQRAGGVNVLAPHSVDGMSHDLARPGFIFMSASQNDASPGESNLLRNGIFTYYLVEGLGGAANSGKKTSVQQAFAYASSRTIATQAGQTPLIIDNTSRSGPSVPLVTRR